MIDLLQVVLSFSVCEILCKLKDMQLSHTFMCNVYAICIYHDPDVVDSDKCKQMGRGRAGGRWGGVG